MPFFTLFFYFLFLDKNKKKKALHKIFAFNNNGPQIEHIAKQTQNLREKNKKNARGS
jgi:superfamily I DNA and RNA helicase